MGWPTGSPPVGLTRMTDKTGKADSLEGLVAMIIVGFQMLSTFLPLENYLAPQYRLANDPVVVTAFPSATLTLVITIACLAFFSFRDVDRMMQAALKSWPLLLFCAYAFVSVTWSAEPSTVINRCARLTIIVVYPIYLVQRFAYDELLKLLTRAFAIAAVSSYVAVAFFPAYGLSLLNGYTDAWRGASSHKNFLGATAALGSLVVFESFRRRASNRLFAAVTFLALLGLLVNARSATGAISALICLVIAAISLLRSPSDKVLVTLLLLTVGLVLALVQQSTDLLSLVGRSSDLTGRTPIWQAVWYIIQRRPILGYGYGFWNIKSSETQIIDGLVGTSVPHSHNNWLDVWIQLGVVGVALAAFLFLRAGRLSLRAMKLGSATTMLPSLLILNIFIRGFSETVLTDPGTASMFWLALSFTMLTDELSRVGQTEPVTASGRRAVGAGRQGGVRRAAGVMRPEAHPPGASVSKGS